MPKHNWEIDLPEELRADIIAAHRALGTKMKTCTQCGTELPATTEYFGPSGQYLRSTCRICTNKKQNAVLATPDGRAKHREASREARRRILATPEGREASRKSASKYSRRIRATDEGRKVNREASMAWKRNNPDKVNALCQKRNAAKLQATPSWGDEAAIKQIYKISADMKRIAGVDCDVDHIFPLRGDFGTGLHHEDNLQVLTAAQHKSKGNKWPWLIPHTNGGGYPLYHAPELRAVVECLPQTLGKAGPNAVNFTSSSTTQKR